MPPTPPRPPWPRPARTTVPGRAAQWAAALAGRGRARPARRYVGPVPARAAGGWAATGMIRVGPRRPPVIGLSQYQPARGVILQPSNGQAIITGAAGAGTATVQIGPAGLGNTWYPAQVTLSTTTGITKGFDSSVANLYLGPSASALTLLGTVFGGNGIVAAALPSIQPGQFLIAQWNSANPGDTAAMNITGTMDALA